MSSRTAGRAALVARNALSVLASDVMNRTTTFVLYALVARQLGTYAFGQMSLALTFFYAAQMFAVAGLKTLLTREAAKRPDRIRNYLRSGSLIVAAASVVSLAGVALLVLVLDYSPDTSAVILLVVLGVFPYALTQVFEGVLQAVERMKYIAYANLPVNVVKVGLAVALLASGRGLMTVVLLLVGAHCAVAATEWRMLRRLDLPPLQAEPGFTLGLARLTRPFLGMEGLVAVTASAIVVLLSQFAGEREVGLYNAASQLMVPIGLVINSAISSVFPDMALKFESDLAGLRKTTGTLFGILVVLVIPAAVGLFYLAEPLLLLLYGEQSFLAAAPVLRILVWILVLRAMTAVLGQVLLASGRERTNLSITGVDAVASVLFGAVLIARFGLLGAAAAALLVQFTDFTLHYQAVVKLMPDLSLHRLLWKPVVASACLAGALALLGDQGLVVVVVAGVLVYAAALAGLELLTTGGLQGVRARYGLGWFD